MKSHDGAASRVSVDTPPYTMGEATPYPKMKDSGVEWLGKVPVHWEVRRLKSWLGINELVLSEDTDPEYTFDYLDIGLVDAGRLTAEPERIRFGNSPSRARRVVRSGDTLVSTVRTYLKAVWHAEDPGANLIASTGFAVLTPRRGTLPRFVSYVCQSDPFTNGVTAESVGIAYPAIAETKLGTFHVCVPPLPEQAAIIRFLDHADRRIQRYTRAKQKLIALLEEQKKAIIHEAVTGRIDVRSGRPYPGYKESGIEWLPEVPQGWERCRLRNVVSVVTTGSRGWSSYASDTGPLFIRVANLSRGSLSLRFDDVVRLDLPATSEARRTRIETGDLLISVTAYIGSVGLAPDGIQEAYVSQHVARCRPLPGVCSRWCGYVLLSTVGQTHGQVSLYGGTKDGLSLDDVKNYPVLLPPRDEQEHAVRWIERNLSALVRVGDVAVRQIALAREYRTRLIADIVTGKVDVREAAERLPEVDPLGVECAPVGGVVRDSGSEHTGWGRGTEEGGPVVDMADRTRTEAGCRS